MIIHRFRFFNGQVKADAMLFHHALVERHDCISRILSVWHLGCVLFRLDQDYLVQFPQVQSFHAKQAPGQVLVMQSGVLCNVKLERAETEPLCLAQGSLLLLQHGTWREVNPAELQRQHPAQWIHFSDYEFTSAKSLGVAHVVIKPAVIIASKSTRSIFNSEEYQASESQQLLLSKLKKGKQHAPSPQSALLSGLFSIGSGLLQGLQGLTHFGSGATSSYPAAPVNQKQNHNHKQAQAPIQPPGWRARFAAFIMQSRLGALIGRQQAQYMHKMMQMFEQGDISNALKHAIPLSDAKQALQQGAPPKVRDHLGISPQQNSASSQFLLQDAFFDSLQAVYERTFERLDKAGRYEEAAFVLAELLAESERAVEYLQAHGQLQLAAELAEGRQLSPAWVIKQWLVAGNVQRAIDIADHTGCYAEAVDLIARKDPDLAADLRTRFADSMASAGQYESAIDMVWPMKDKPNAVQDWMATVIAQGGTSGAKMLIKKVAMTQSLTSSLVALQALFQDRTEASFPKRQAAIEAILGSSLEGDTQKLVEFAIRSHLMDRSAGFACNDKTLKNLLKYCHNSALQTDIKPLPIQHRKQPEKPRLAERSSIWQVDWETSFHPGIEDMTMLPKNRFLLARGESGVHIVNALGRCLKRFHAPCHHLVLSDQQNRAILLAKRDRHVTLHQLNLTDNRMTPWLQLHIDAFANTFDGRVWLVAQGNQLLALDVQTQEAKALWQVNDLPGTILSIVRDPHSVALLLETNTGYEVWRYQLPSMSLKQRQPTERYSTEPAALRAICTDGTLVKAAKIEDNPDLIRFSFVNQKGVQTAQTDLPAVGEIDQLVYSPDWICFRTQRQAEYQWHFANRGPNVAIRCQVSQAERMRLFEQTCLLFDQRGGVLCLDLVHGTQLNGFSAY